MVPAFGFSVGDFIAAAGLITKVAKALDDKSGAAAEYQYVQIELEALARTLKHLEGLEPNESNISHINAIRGMALTCRIPLQQFLERVAKFEHSMGAFSTVGSKSMKVFGRKSQWAVFMSDEVAELRAAVGAKVLSINLLLATHTSESISRVEAHSHRSHATLSASILDLRSQAASTNKTLRTTQSLVVSVRKEQKDHARQMKRSMDDVTTTLCNVSEATAATNSAVMSFRDLAIQLLQMIQDLPQQVRVTLEQVVRTNLEMYTMLRDIRTFISRLPSYDPADTFRFEDVLGRPHILPYLYFRHKEVFTAFLETEFKGLPGEQQVFQKEYLISDNRRNWVENRNENWAMTVFPGADLAMSTLVKAIFTIKCLGPHCRGQVTTRELQDLLMTWKCDKRFIPAAGASIDEDLGNRLNINLTQREVTLRELDVFRRVHFAVKYIKLSSVAHVVHVLDLPLSNKR